jgi:hypothetical protein
VTKSDVALRAIVAPPPEVAERSVEIDADVRRLQELIERARSAELPPEVKDGIRFVPVHTLEEVLKVARPRHHHQRRMAMAICDTPYR